MFKNLNCSKWDLKESIVNTYKKSNAGIFLTFYSLKLYEARRFEKSLTAKMQYRSLNAFQKTSFIINYWPIFENIFDFLTESLIFEKIFYFLTESLIFEKFFHFWPILKNIVDFLSDTLIFEKMKLSHFYFCFKFALTPLKGI